MKKSADSATPLKPAWPHLEEVARATKDELLLAAPYIRKEALDRIQANLHGKVATKVVVMTCLDVRDWVAGASDPEALLAFVRKLEAQGIVVTIRVVDDLHAKLFVADQQLALLGSANLTRSAFDRNIEMAVRLEGELAQQAQQELVQACVGKSRLVDVDLLIEWLKKNKKRVLELRRSRQKEIRKAEKLQKSLSETARKEKKVAEAPPGGARAAKAPDGGDLEDFIGWLEANEKLFGAREVVIKHRRLPNAQGKIEQHSGHVRQSFHCVKDFLLEHPDFIGKLVAWMDVPRHGRFGLKHVDGLKDAWIRHMRKNKRVEKSDYSYPTLRKVLPPNQGGSLPRGGGASPTFHYVMPLVAKFLKRGRR